MVAPPTLSAYPEHSPLTLAVRDELPANATTPAQARSGLARVVLLQDLLALEYRMCEEGEDRDRVVADLEELVSYRLGLEASINPVGNLAATIQKQLVQLNASQARMEARRRNKRAFKGDVPDLVSLLPNDEGVYPAGGPNQPEQPEALANVAHIVYEPDIHKLTEKDAKRYLAFYNQPQDPINVWNALYEYFY